MSPRVLLRHPCPQPGCDEMVAGRGEQSDGRCPDHARPTPAQRGYDKRWARRAARFLLDNPYCVWPDCIEDATVADHVTPREQLLAQGVRDPDVDRYLQALCRGHHSIKTHREHGRGVG